MEAAGGAFVGPQVNEKLDLQTNVLHDMQANRGMVKANGGFQKFQTDDLNLADEDIENFLPD